MGKDIFISYSRKDLQKTRELVLKIEKETNADCWIDWNGIESGEQFEDVIVNAIDASKLVIYILSANSMESHYAKKEISYAYNTHKKIIPIKIDKCELQGWFLFKFGDLDYIEADNDLQMSKLIRNLNDIFPQNKCTEYKDEHFELSIPTEDSLSNEQLMDIGEDYFYGDNGKDRDINQAILYFKRAGELGNIDAMIRVADLYHKGEQIPTNKEDAFFWYKKAAEFNDGYAYFQLGVYYENGYNVVEVNPSQAFNCFKQSAILESIDGIYKYATCNMYGYGTPVDISEAITNYKILADKNYPNAWNNLGVCYERLGDSTQAFFWYKKAAEENISASQSNVGMYYYYGSGVEQNYQTAVEWFKKAASQNYPDALNFLGVCYENGNGVEKDNSIAVDYYRRAAELGHPFAQNNYGSCLLNGKGLKEDFQLAFRWFKKSASQGNLYGLYNLGFCYENGYGIRINFNEAISCYKLAAQQGLQQAVDKLKEMN